MPRSQDDGAPGPAPPGRTGPAASVLVVEPWLSGSHRAWAEGFQRHSRHRVEVLGGKPTGWRSTLARSAAELAGRAGPPPDVVVASSMMDLSEFVARSGFQHVPTLLYMHENQLTYDRSKPDRERGAANWRSVEAADRVAFNSRFHLDDFFDAVPVLGVSDTDRAAALAKSGVLPVGIDGAACEPNRRDDGSCVLLWNHRWEADKDPAAFWEALGEVGGLPFRVILAGEGSSSHPLAGRIIDRFGDRVIHAGFAPRPWYTRLLRSADVVVSTARQEFFGVSVAEAMACGAVPLVPNRLAYPELLGSRLGECLYEPGTLASRLGWLLESRLRCRELAPAARAAGKRFDWRLVAPRYDELIDAMV